MRLRSMLFVPGDSERKIARGRETAADALILDLEDAVAPARKGDARRIVAAVFDDPAPRDWQLFVRINPLDTGLTEADLAAIVRPGLDGIVLPKANDAGDVIRIAADLDKREAENGVSIGHVRIVVVATETPAAIFALGSYAPNTPRLAGLTWGAEDLSAAVGATANKETDGRWTEPYRLARSLCLFAAANAGVAPLDTLYADYRDHEGLAEDCRRSRRDGFTGRLAIHPDQIETINRGYSPTDADVAHARRLVEAFAAEPDAGTVGLDGKMYDIPHLKAARRTLGI